MGAFCFVTPLPFSGWNLQTMKVWKLGGIYFRSGSHQLSTPLIMSCSPFGLLL